ncbi:hypothetical protein Acr_15g0009230 [Actinidia rufa]|uniref:Uncharacterized protein n=1 Tax=Actinidia rufa TaxID=165716 RepID=A0A7J0FUD5_9ERIC|nr:hypothetical protein Acr_15g0009230 [Actinidia rufa]
MKKKYTQEHNPEPFPPPLPPQGRRAPVVRRRLPPVPVPPPEPLHFLLWQAPHPLPPGQQPPRPNLLLTANILFPRPLRRRHGASTGLPPRPPHRPTPPPPPGPLQSALSKFPLFHLQPHEEPPQPTVIAATNDYNPFVPPLSTMQGGCGAAPTELSQIFKQKYIDTNLGPNSTPQPPQQQPPLLPSEEKSADSWVQDLIHEPPPSPLNSTNPTVGSPVNNPSIPGYATTPPSQPI